MLFRSDIIAHMGKDFHRVRIGVGHPGSKDQVVDFVLHRANKADQAAIDESMEDALRALPLLIEGSWEKAVNRLHSK